ncbi:hypothetical protein CDAR_541491 [Caerostris darwini]|uniref:Uncharacterized protein n=1 Tax=Caerostris darwini TaxID=1538125 RepID=A0AAV4VX43_9ARAC|nr:hypothetical protein CDAR_541491 [Caerostris darwini]
MGSTTCLTFSRDVPRDGEIVIGRVLYPLSAGEGRGLQNGKRTKIRTKREREKKSNLKFQSYLFTAPRYENSLWDSYLPLFFICSFVLSPPPPPLSLLFRRTFFVRPEAIGR